MINYDAEQLDREVLAWYSSNISKLEDLPVALGTLRKEYEPRENNASFRISSRLQGLADLGCGLQIRWKYSDLPEEEGCIWHWGRHPEQCGVTQPQRFGLVSVNYSDILEVKLVMPSNYQENNGATKMISREDHEG